MAFCWAKNLNFDTIGTLHLLTYRQISNLSHTLVGIIYVDHSDVVGASAVGADPATSLNSINT